MRSLVVSLLFLFTAVTAFAQCVTTCGSERWNIKTGCDAAAADIDLDPGHALDTSIADLRDLDPPSDIRHFEGRAPGVEDQLFVIEGTLTMFKSESDNDLHLVLTDGSKSMIAEIPKPTCVTSSSPFHDAVHDVHECFSNYFNGKKSKKGV